MREDGSPSLRIGMVGPLPPPSGGMANQTVQLIRLLRESGHKVTVVQVNSPYAPNWIGKIPVVRSWFRLVPYLVALWRAAGEVDIFHVMANSGWSWHLYAAPAVWIAKSRRVAVVVNYRGGEAEVFLARAKRLVAVTMRRAATLIVPSEFLKGIFAKFELNAQIVPNIVDLSRFRPRESRLGSSASVLVARNLEPLYDNRTAIFAFGLIRQVLPEAQLTIAGSGPQEQELKQLVLNNGLADCVEFAGRLEPDAMAAKYRAADLMINPSLADNMPNSLLEAWASGVPVVSTNVGGIPFMARDGENATLIPPKDPEKMAQACLELLCDNSLWARRAQSGISEARRYTWQQVQPLLMDVYRKALLSRA